LTNYQHIRRAVSLGTSLTALFLLVRCSVPGRDYSQLGIGDSAGNGGSAGDEGDIILHGDLGGSSGSAGQGGQGGQGDLGDAGGLGGSGVTPPEPIPCDWSSNDAGVNDAGTGDAGTENAGTEDAGTEDATCECVDGFIRPVDADGDGDGTRACSLVPGLDCDDGDAEVTHNSCGGCTTLPNTVGTDCLDCGAFICDGPESVVCASKPGALEDPDCRCLNALVVARDIDNDGAGTRLCEVNPGNDCNDGNASFIMNACGGCEPAPGALGAACNQCGVYACNDTAIVCSPQVGVNHCDGNTRQTCQGTGYWGNDFACANVCYAGNCEACTPGTFYCSDIGGGSELLYKCISNAGSSSSLGIGWTSWASCTGNTCNPTNGNCLGYLLLPRDQSFDVVPQLRPGLPWHDVLNTALEADYG
jgi:hypothetical protein